MFVCFSQYILFAYILKHDTGKDFQDIKNTGNI